MNRNTDLREVIRRQMRADTEIPPELIDEAVDLAFHAGDSAMKAMETVCFSGSDPRLAITIVSLAVSLLEVRLDQVGQAAKALARDSGLEVIEGKIGGRF